MIYEIEKELPSCGSKIQWRVQTQFLYEWYNKYLQIRMIPQYLDFDTKSRHNSFEMSIRNLKSWSQKGISHTVVKISPR